MPKSLYVIFDIIITSFPDTEIPVIPDIPVIRIGFSPTIYSVSEDDGFAKLTIIKTKLNTSETTENITVFFYTSDVTAKGYNYIGTFHRHGMLVYFVDISLIASKLRHI